MYHLYSNKKKNLGELHFFKLLLLCCPIRYHEAKRHVQDIVGNPPGFIEKIVLRAQQLKTTFLFKIIICKKNDCTVKVRKAVWVPYEISLYSTIEAKRKF